MILHQLLRIRNTKAASAPGMSGDSDTLACITGGIAEAFFGGVPDGIGERALSMLDEALREVTLEFCGTFGRETS